jgi:large subunit ribosomal protein L19
MRLSVSARELMQTVETPQLKGRLPRFSPGDTLRVTIRVPEGAKERLQLFEGIVISKRGGGTREMVTIRRTSFGIGVERTFPLHSPFVSKWEVVSRGKARRAKLFYLREKTGRDAKLRRDYGADETPVVTAEEAVAALTPEEQARADAAKADREAKKAARTKRKADQVEKNKAAAKAKAKESGKPK